MASHDIIPVPGISLVKGPDSSLYACIISDHPAIVDFVANFGCASITKRYLDDIIDVTIKNAKYFSAAVSHSPSANASVAATPSTSLHNDSPPVDDDSLELLAFDRLAANGSAASANGDSERPAGGGGIDPESLLSFKCVCGKQCTSSSGLSRHRKLCESFKTTLAAHAPDSPTIDAPTPDSLPFVETAPTPVPVPAPAPDAISAA